MEWLTGRTKYEISSITASTGRSASGADLTQNRPRKCAPFLTKPSTVTPTKTISASTAVTAICEVGEKDLGSRPRKLVNRMKQNSVMT